MIRCEVSIDPFHGFQPRLEGGDQVKVLRQLLKKEEGQTLSEYGMILFFLVIVAIAAVTLLGTNITAIFNAVATAFS
jgi:pilus assembly protein Flp/PilA